MADERDPTTPSGGRDVALRLRDAVRRVALDFSPLRTSRDFRLLWLGLFASMIGSQFTIVATFIQVFRLTHSVAAVGLLGLVGFVALLAATVAGATFLDALDRRKILIGAQLGYAVSTGVLFAGATLSTRPPTGVIYLAVAGIAASSALDSPTRNAITSRLLGREQLPAAFALNQVTWSAATLAGPAIAGLLVGALGFSWAYGIDFLCTLLQLSASLALRPIPGGREESLSMGWRSLREGIGFLGSRRVLQATFLIDVIATVFGNPRALFPVLALTQFRNGPEVVGLMFAAPAAGAFIGVMTSGWVGRVHRQGSMVICAVVVWGAGIAAFGLVGANLLLALLLLAVAGAADVVSAVFRNTILQVTTPDRLRGRLSGLHFFVVTGGPRLGDFEAGYVAQLFSPTISVVSGGLMCVLGAFALAWRVPDFRHYDVRPRGDPPLRDRIEGGLP